MPDLVVMLARGFENTFRRQVRDDKGEPVETLEFEPLVPVRVPEKMVPVIRNDIGKALIVCNEKGGIFKRSDEATAEFLATPKPKKRAAKKRDEPKRPDEPVHGQPVPEQE